MLRVYKEILVLNLSNSSLDKEANEMEPSHFFFLAGKQQLPSYEIRRRKLIINICWKKTNWLQEKSGVRIKKYTRYLRVV